MEVKGLSPMAFETIVGSISHARYDNNVRVGTLSVINAAGTRFRGRVIVSDSRGPGARRSGTGRRMPAACWHVFRDVVRATLAAYPDAVIRTGMARYDAATFEATYRETGRRNVGSMLAPVTMPELCECGEGAE